MAGAEGAGELDEVSRVGSPAVGFWFLYYCAFNLTLIIQLKPVSDWIREGEASS